MHWEDCTGKVESNCVVFFKVREEWGSLSNMAGGFALEIAGIKVPSAEALYQAMRFSHLPEIQREIVSQKSPMAAKMKAKKDGRRELLTRCDWNEVRLQVMRWVLRVKLVQCWGEFFVDDLLATGSRPIVERSRKDRFWGAVPDENGVLRGENMLGQLLMELREEVRQWLYGGEDEIDFPPVHPPVIAGFTLLECEVEVI